MNHKNYTMDCNLAIKISIAFCVRGWEKLHHICPSCEAMGYKKILQAEGVQQLPLNISATSTPSQNKPNMKLLVRHFNISNCHTWYKTHSSMIKQFHIYSNPQLRIPEKMTPSKTSPKGLETSQCLEYLYILNIKDTTISWIFWLTSNSAAFV